MWIDSELRFKPHIDHVMKKVNVGVGVLYCSRHSFTFNVRKRLVSQLVLPIMNYADVVSQNASKTDVRPLGVIYNRLYTRLFFFYTPLHNVRQTWVASSRYKMSISLVSIYFKMY